MLVFLSGRVIRSALASFPFFSWSSLLAAQTEITSADGIWSAQVSDNTLMLSHLPTKRVIDEWKPESGVTDVRFVPATAPRWVVISGDDEFLRLWPLTGPDLVTYACALLHGVVTPSAWAKLTKAHGTAICEAP